ncbi:MAG: class I SAM-dependent methyltransferase [Candidatus Omnitrophota bacterium]
MAVKTAVGYDRIARAYQRWQKSLIRKWSLEFSFFKYLGSVEDKDVLDLACGEGNYTRRLKALGARGVVGVDISGAMIELALEQERAQPAGIFYRQENAATLGRAGDYDVVTAAYLLHYSRTRQELDDMCRTIYANLRSGGRFVSLNLDPLCPRQSDKRFDCTIEAPARLTEGCVVKVISYLDGRRICAFENTHWGLQTYENALRRAGFPQIKWHSIEVSPEGIRHFGEAFWRPYLKQAGVLVIECAKP